MATLAQIFALLETGKTPTVSTRESINAIEAAISGLREFVSWTTISKAKPDDGEQVVVRITENDTTHQFIAEFNQDIEFAGVQTWQLGYGNYKLFREVSDNDEWKRI